MQRVKHTPRRPWVFADEEMGVQEHRVNDTTSRPYVMTSYWDLNAKASSRPLSPSSRCRIHSPSSHLLWAQRQVTWVGVEA